MEVFSSPHIPFILYGNLLTQVYQLQQNQVKERQKQGVIAKQATKTKASYKVFNSISILKEIVSHRNFYCDSTLHMKF